MNPIITDEGLERMAAKRANIMYNAVNARAHSMLLDMLQENGPVSAEKKEKESEEETPKKNRRRDYTEEENKKDAVEGSSSPPGSSPPKKRRCGLTGRSYASIRAALEAHLVDRGRILRKHHVRRWLNREYPDVIADKEFLKKLSVAQYSIQRKHAHIRLVKTQKSGGGEGE